MEMPKQSSPRLYVGVLAISTAEGIRPRVIIFPGGTKYKILRITDVRLASSYACGGYGTRYTCCVDDKLLHLYRDAKRDKRWYIDISTVEDMR